VGLRFSSFPESMSEAVLHTAPKAAFGKGSGALVHRVLERGCGLMAGVMRSMVGSGPRVAPDPPTMRRG
jgi:hypothetical protein